MIYYHVSVISVNDRLMHDGYYSKIEEAVETAKWWLSSTLFNVRTWVSYH